jgi:dolichyl-phosphate beta-glucosyltransferase
MPNDGRPKLSLVIPAYREAHRLPAALEELIDFGRGFKFEWEVWVIVERSPDGTVDLARQATAKQANFRVVDNPVQRGKGYAVRTGMLRATGDLVFFMDADLSVPLEEIPAFVEYFDRHPDVDVLVGNRQHAASRIVKEQAWLRRTMGQTFNRLLRACAGVTLRDTQCGFKAFRRKAARAVFERQTLDGFAFDVEVLLLAERLGFRVEDLPVQWLNSPESRVRLVADSARMLWDAVRVRRIVNATLRSR